MIIKLHTNITYYNMHTMIIFKKKIMILNENLILYSSLCSNFQNFQNFRIAENSCKFNFNYHLKDRIVITYLMLNVITQF